MTPNQSTTLQNQLRMFMYAKGLDARTLLHDLGLQPRDIMAWMQRQRPEVRRPLNIKAPVGHRLQLNGRIIQWIRSKRDHVPDQYLQAISISPLLPETLQARYCSSTQIDGRPERVCKKRKLKNAVYTEKYKKNWFSIERIRTTHWRPLEATASRTLQLREQDDLIPIRLDIDMFGVRYLDAFTWNRDEKTISPQRFAARIVADGRLDPRLVDPIEESIRRQIQAYEQYVANDSVSLHPIVLDICLNDLVLHDQFEWDINSKSNVPEDFAATLRYDLGLPQAFEPKIALSIREQVYQLQLAFLHPDLCQGTRSGGKIKPCVKTMGPVRHVVRTQEDLKQGKWEPIVSQLSIDEMTRVQMVEAQRHEARSNQVVEPIKTTTGVSKPDSSRPSSRENKTRPINAFIAFCQTRRAELAASTTKSSVEITKILAEEWRNFSDAQKVPFNGLAEQENEKRQYVHEMEQKMEEVWAWEQEEARRKGLVNEFKLDPDRKHIRSLFLQDYHRERTVSKF